MLDIIQYEFNISIRLMKDFFESESAWPLIEGMARSWALVRSLLLAWLIGGKQMMQGMPWVSQYFTEHPLIRWIADLSKCRASLWQETPLHCLFQHTLQSTSTLRIKQPPPRLRCVCESGYEGGSSPPPTTKVRSGMGDTFWPNVTSSWRCHVTYLMTSNVHDGGQNALFYQFVNQDIFWYRYDKAMVSFSNRSYIEFKDVEINHVTLTGDLEIWGQTSFNLTIHNKTCIISSTTIYMCASLQSTVGGIST